MVVVPVDQLLLNVVSNALCHPLRDLLGDAGANEVGSWTSAAAAAAAAAIGIERGRRSRHCRRNAGDCCQKGQCCSQNSECDRHRDVGGGLTGRRQMLYTLLADDFL